MSLYNMLFGLNPISDILLATLNLTRKDVGRFRDAYLDEGKIAIYTRNGGGNREHYPEDEKTEPGLECHCTGCIIEYQLPQHPCYLSDKDDDFDCTYATVYFKFPEEFAEELKKLDKGEKFDPDQRWQAMIEAIKTMPLR